MRIGSDFGGVLSSAVSGVVLRAVVARLLAFLAGATGVSKVSGVGMCRVADSTIASPDTLLGPLQPRA